MKILLSKTYTVQQLRMLFILLPLILNSCVSDPESLQGTKRPEVPEVVDVAEILNQKNLPEKMKAEKLVLAGEKLLSPIGFMYAYEVFGRALEIDPTNKKALFYKALVAPLMKFHGIMIRIEPLIKKGTEEGKKRYQQEVSGLVAGGLREFLLDGKPDIDTESKLQDFIISTRGAQDKLRLFLKANKELVLNLKVNLFQHGLVQQCSAIKTEEGVYKQSTCDLISVQDRKVDRADIEILQHMVAGLQVYSILLTAYDGSGIQGLDNLGQRARLTEEAMVEHLKAESQFGQLRKSHGLSDIPKLGSDIFAGAKWAYRMQEFLCPLDRKGGSLNRQGYLVNSGICISTSTPNGTPTEQIFNLIEIAFQGLPQAFDFRASIENESRVVAVANFNPLAPFFDPKPDLKTLLPTQFDHCGKTNGFADRTLGGMFPDGDSNKIFLAYKGLLNETDREGSPCK